MAVRTSSSAVEAIVEDYDSTISMTPFIEVASSIVDDVVDVSSSDYGATKLELIERWLAAHFYTVRDKYSRVTQERAGSVGQMFAYKHDLYLASTLQGQTAMALDHEGHLAALVSSTKKGKRKKAGITWLGKGTTEGDDDTT